MRNVQLPLIIAVSSLMSSTSLNRDSVLLHSLLFSHSKVICNMGSPIVTNARFVHHQSIDKVPEGIAKMLFSL